MLDNNIEWSGFIPAYIMYMYVDYNDMEMISTLLALCEENPPVTGGLLTLCEGNPPVTGGFPSQRASNEDMVVALNKSRWFASGLRCHSITIM